MAFAGGQGDPNRNPPPTTKKPPAGGNKKPTGGNKKPAKPSGPTREKFVMDVLHGLGIAKPSQAQINVMLDWAQSENTVAGYNPLAIDGAYESVYGTHMPPGGSPARNPDGSPINGPKNPVWNFASYEQGVTATIAVIQHRFPGIYTAIHSGNPNGIIDAIYASHWGSAPVLGHGAGTGNTQLGTQTSSSSDSSGSAAGTAQYWINAGYTPAQAKKLAAAYNANNPNTSNATLQDYLARLSQWGIPINSQTVASAQQALGQKLSVAAFEYTVEHEPWFASMFPGIFGPGGVLKMSPQQYNAEFMRYQGIASQYGQTLSRHAFGYALGKNIDPGTFQNRMAAIQFVDSNQQDFAQFEQTLKARGLLGKNKNLTRAEALHIAEGTGPVEWNRVWEEAYLRGAAANAGLQFGRDVSRNMILNLMKEHPELYNQIQGGGSEAIQSKMYQLAQDLKTTAPASRLYGMGLTPQDFQQLEFGGPNQAEVAIRAQRALDTLKASQAPQAAEGELGALGQRLGTVAQSTLKQGAQSPFPTP